MNKKLFGLSPWFALSILVSGVMNSFGMDVEIDPRKRIESAMIDSQELNELQRELAQELPQAAAYDRMSINSRRNERVRQQVVGVMGRAGIKKFGSDQQSAPSALNAPAYEAPPPPKAVKANNRVRETARSNQPSALDDLDVDELLYSESAVLDPSSLDGVCDEELADETEDLYSMTLEGVPTQQTPPVKQAKARRTAPSIASQPSTESLLKKNHEKEDGTKRSKSKGSFALRSKSPRSPRPVSQEKTKGAPEITVVTFSKKGTVPVSQNDPDRRFRKAYNQYVMECSAADRRVELAYPACFHEFCTQVRVLNGADDSTNSVRNIDNEIKEQDEQLMNAFFHWAVKILPLEAGDAERIFKAEFNRYVLIAADRGHESFLVYADCFREFCESQQKICNREHSERKEQGDTTTPRRKIPNEVVEQNPALAQEFLQWLLKSKDL